MSENTSLIIDFNETLKSGELVLNFGGLPPVIKYLSLVEIVERLIINAKAGNKASQGAIEIIVINKFKDGRLLVELEAAALPY